MKDNVKALAKAVGLKKVVDGFRKGVAVKPYLDPKMELRYSLWEGISSIHCHDGRQLGENNVAPELYRDNIPTRLQVCPHSNPDGTLLMNVSALESMMKNWDVAIPFILAFRKDFNNRFAVSSKALSLYDVFLLAKLCVCLPIFQARRQPSLTKDGDVSALVATQFQLISGMFMVVRKMLEQGEPWLNPSMSLDADALFEYADRQKVFVTERGFICAGSKRKILEFMQIVIDPTNPDVDPNWDQEIDKQVEGRREEYYQYFQAGVGIELVTKLVKVLASHLFYASPLQFRQDILDKSERVKRLQGLCYFDPNSLIIINEQRRIILELLDRLSFSDLVKELVTHFDATIAKNENQDHGDFSLVSAELCQQYRELLTTSLPCFQMLQDSINKSLNLSSTTSITGQDVHQAIVVFDNVPLNKISV